MTNLLLTAMILVESADRLHPNGNDLARGEHGERGCLQVRQCVLDDVNKKFGFKFTTSEMENRGKCMAVLDCYLYLWATPKRLGRPVTDQDRARIWNGGPDGWKLKRSLPYWRKVQATMHTLSQHG
jgi:hypothetical protein